MEKERVLYEHKIKQLKKKKKRKKRQEVKDLTHKHASSHNKIKKGKKNLHITHQLGGGKYVI